MGVPRLRSLTLASLGMTFSWPGAVLSVNFRVMAPPVAADPTTRLSQQAAVAIRAAIRLAGGREVCFVCTVDSQGVVRPAGVVAGGDAVSVLALPGFAARGELLVHNHPS